MNCPIGVPYWRFSLLEEVFPIGGARSADAMKASNVMLQQMQCRKQLVLTSNCYPRELIRFDNILPVLARAFDDAF